MSYRLIKVHSVLLWFQNLVCSMEVGEPSALIALFLFWWCRPLFFCIKMIVVPDSTDGLLLLFFPPCHWHSSCLSSMVLVWVNERRHRSPITSRSLDGNNHDLLFGNVWPESRKTTLSSKSLLYEPSSWIHELWMFLFELIQVMVRLSGIGLMFHLSFLTQSQIWVQMGGNQWQNCLSNGSNTEPEYRRRGSLAHQRSRLTWCDAIRESLNLYFSASEVAGHVE